MFRSGLSRGWAQSRFQMQCDRWQHSCKYHSWQKITKLCCIITLGTVSRWLLIASLTDWGKMKMLVRLLHVFAHLFIHQSLTKSSNETECLWHCSQTTTVTGWQLYWTFFYQCDITLSRNSKWLIRAMQSHHIKKLVKQSIISDKIRPDTRQL